MTSMAAQVLIALCPRGRALLTAAVYRIGGRCDAAPAKKSLAHIIAQSKNSSLVASDRLDQKQVNAHVSMVIQLGTFGSLGMVGGSTPLVLSGLALIFLVLIIASKHLLRKGTSKERRSAMETKSNVNTNINLSKSVHEALHEFAVSFGAGFLGGTIPSIVPLRLAA